MTDTAHRDATVAARVPLDLRADLEAVADSWRGAGVMYPDGRPADLSYVIRLACRRLCDEVIGHGPAGDAALPRDLDTDPTAHGADLTLLDNGRPGAYRRGDPPTSRNAALNVAARAGTQRRRALEAFEAAGNQGLTADEVVVKLAPAPHNGVARRVTDLLQGDLIEAVPHDDAEERAHGIPATRRTRAGAQATIYRITGNGLLALTRKRKEEAGAA